MYTTYFGLNAPPFSITPDPHYLYLSKRHHEALAHLLYGVNEGHGFILLTGEVGTGKTTLCRCLIEQLPETADFALLLNPQLNPKEFLATLFDELHIHYDESFTLKNFIDTLTTYLLTAHAVGRRTVLILDESQNLAPEVLEQVRLLTNLETDTHKLLQIILVGQPELKNLLKQQNLRQLAQRITARYHLLPLSYTDTQAYINHRSAISGARTPLFTNAAMRLIYHYSSGVPRLINIICDRALLSGYVNRQNPVDAPVVQKATREVRGENVNRLLSVGWIVSIVGVVLVLSLLGWWLTWPATGTQRVLQEDSRTKVISLPLNRDSRSIPGELGTNSDTEATETADGLFNLMKGAHVRTDTETAFTTLFQQWRLEYPKLKGDTACERARTQGLSCLYKTGNWDDIRRFNRPTLIELVGELGEQYHTVLTSLRGDVATLDFGGKTTTFPVSEISQYWRGQFLLLWRPPALPVVPLKVGMSREEILWVKKQLNKITGNTSGDLSSLFDSALKQRLIGFQKQYHLTSDGVIGEETLVMLDTLSGQNPFLDK